MAAAPFTGDAPIPGTTSLVHLDENLAAEEVSLTDDEFDAIALLVPEDEQDPTSA
jgi:aryl-alcohol dehydrogenase-like predicted oxidoreductase